MPMIKLPNETPVSIMMVRKIEVGSANPLILGLSDYHQAERIVVRNYYKIVDALPSCKEQEDGPTKLLRELYR